MPEIGWAFTALILVILFAGLRRARLVRASIGTRVASQQVSLEDMRRTITDLTPTLRPAERVTAPQSSVESGHIWNSPCGKRVYIN